MGISYFVIYVKDIERSIAFYRDVLGLEKGHNYSEENGKVQKCFMCNPGTKPMVDWPMIELVSGMEGKSTVQSGHLIGVEVASVAEAEKKLIEQGFAPNAPAFSPGPGCLVEEFNGPDGELIEIMEVTDRSLF